MDALIPPQRPARDMLARIAVVPTTALERIDRRLTRIERELGIVIIEEGEIIMDVATVKADFDQYKTDVRAAFDRLEASIAAGNPDQQALADLDAAIKGADEEANAEDQPAPPAGETPVPSASGDGGDAGA